MLPDLIIFEEINQIYFLIPHRVLYKPLDQESDVKILEARITSLFAFCNHLTFYITTDSF